MAIKAKIFNNREIIIRPLLQKDLKTPEKFKDFINSLVKEKALISRNENVTLKDEEKFLKGSLVNMKKKKNFHLVAEDKNKNLIVGITSIFLCSGVLSHVGNLGILVRKDYRGKGLGKFMLKEIIRLSKKGLKPRPKVIRLSVFPNNKPAIKLYRKFGFKTVAKIPRQFEYKGRLLDEVIMLFYL
jgi:RimJ/RimL family protein N-acetyltransferase